MKEMREFDIPFAGLKLGKHQFEFEISNQFFEAFEYTEFNAAALNVKVNLEKQTTMLEFHLETEGVVNVDCDLTAEPYDQAVQGELQLVVKFGEEYNDENDDILIIPHGEHKVNLAQYIYEMCVLAVPTKRVHPKVVDGTMDSEILERLEALQPKTETEKTEQTDPRWDALKNLMTDN